MAVITANATVLYESGSAERVVLYLVKEVTTGDTIDVSAKFSALKSAVSVPAGDLATGDVCAVASTVVTLDVVGAADSILYVLVVGLAAL